MKTEQQAAQNYLMRAKAILDKCGDKKHSYEVETVIRSLNTDMWDETERPARISIYSGAL